jgi:hypothetical protein
VAERHGTLTRIVDSHAFATVILGVIVDNAVVLGLQTYDEIASRRGALLDLLNGGER